VGSPRAGPFCLQTRRCLLAGPSAYMQTRAAARELPAGADHCGRAASGGAQRGRLALLPLQRFCLPAPPLRCALTAFFHLGRAQARRRPVLELLLFRLKSAFTKTLSCLLCCRWRFSELSQKTLTFALPACGGRTILLCETAAGALLAPSSHATILLFLFRRLRYPALRVARLQATLLPALPEPEDDARACAPPRTQQLRHALLPRHCTRRITCGHLACAMRFIGHFSSRHRISRLRAGA